MSTVSTIQIFLGLDYLKLHEPRIIFYSNSLNTRAIIYSDFGFGLASRRWNDCPAGHGDWRVAKYKD